MQYAAGVVCGAVARCSVGVYLALRAFQDLNYYYMIEPWIEQVDDLLDNHAVMKTE